VSEKRHPPTARRLEEARQQGKVARSRLFTSAWVTLGALVGALPTAGRAAADLRAYALRLLAGQAPAPEAALWDGLLVLAWALAPTLAGASLAALASSLITAGLQLRPGLVTPRLSRLDLAAGLRALVSPGKVVELAKGLTVAALVAWPLARAAQALAPAAFRTVARDGGQGLPALLDAWRPVVLQGAVWLAALGAVDLVLARRRHLSELKMSPEEVRTEHRNAEGDPRARGQRKALHRALASGTTARGVHSATAVVVNPTHIAIALRYVEAESDAPYIVAKGREEDAMTLRSQAHALGIPVVKDVPLARSLVHHDVGDEVPEELYQAAAAVLKVALEASRKRDAVQAALARQREP
jgi:type III secretion protein U